MNKYIVLYNPYSAKGHGLESAKKLAASLPGAEISYEDLTRVTDHQRFFRETPPDTKIIFTGGDGTLNRVANALYGEKLPREIWYFPAGSGNDFVNDLRKPHDCAPFVLNDYIQDLPKVRIRQGEYRFLNAVGYGLDGYCCEESDRLHEKGRQRSYTMIAFLGLMGKYKTTAADVTVDGVTKHYDKVWMAPAMFGSFYGGGVNMGPMQHRDNPEKLLTSVVIHSVGRLKTLFLFLNVCKGRGEKYPKYIDYRRGHRISVRFDRPTALQVDGETFLSVEEYEATYGI